MGALTLPYPLHFYGEGARSGGPPSISADPQKGKNIFLKVWNVW